MKELKKRIKNIPGEDGWWKESGEENFNKIAKRLIDRDFTEDEVIDILEECYWVVSEEYGN